MVLCNKCKTIQKNGTKCPTCGCLVIPYKDDDKPFNELEEKKSNATRDFSKEEVL